MKKSQLKPGKPLQKKALPKAKQGIKKVALKNKKQAKSHTPHKIKIKSDSPLGRLIQKTDTVHSMLVRIMAANELGIVKCYTCDKKAFWKASGMECGHFQSRSNMGTRYSLIGAKPQCNHCNQSLNGNLKVFEENLVKEHGQVMVDMIKQLAKKVVTVTIEDIRSIKAELSFMLKNIRKEKGL